MSASAIRLLTRSRARGQVELGRWLSGSSCKYISSSLGQGKLSFSLQKSDFSTVLSRSVLDLDEDPLSAEEAAAEEEALRKKELLEELDNKKGRGWSDPWDLEDMMNSKEKFEDLPEWSPSLVSRVSEERVQIYPDKIPTLQSLAELALPPPPPPHPGHGHAKSYALYRKRSHFKYILEQVKSLAEPKVASIQGLPDWQDKQDAVDELFEEIEFQLKETESILGKHPHFGTWVERALEQYLRSIQKNPDKDTNEASDSNAVPVFMDCHGPDDSETDVVPKILSPLNVKPQGTVGDMMEQWELSAHKTSKRVMLRQSTRAIGRALVDSQQARILVSGRQGVGKTAAIISIVASARTSGYIVLYLPDGDQLHQNGYYIEPNEKRPGIYDLPVLSQHACENFLKSHEKELADVSVDSTILENHFSEDQLQRLSPTEETSLVDLLKFGAETTSCAAPCYSAALDVLMNQEETPFMIVVDEFNCFFKPGQYFHADYDENVRNPIPYNQISLFKPALDAMALSEDCGASSESKMMKRGAVLVAMTCSHAVPVAVTDALVDKAKEIAHDDDQSIQLFHIEVPRLSALEVEHVLANFEATGVGKLRMDRGETVMNSQEVNFLRMVSGGVAQKLMDACIM